MRTSCAVLATAAAAATSTSVSGHPSGRRLEDAEGNSYVYLDDVSSYKIQYGKCVRVKVPNENDDDGGGNSIFINGKYYAQYYRYASFFLCDDDACGSSCDYSVEYVTDLDSYLETHVDYVQTFCGACAAQCGRRLEEEGGNNANVAIDCSTCKDQCSLYSSGGGENDEVDFLQCQEAYADEENDIQYYTGSQCHSDGSLFIGLFYDDECTVKTSSSKVDYGFKYNTFKTVQQICVDCDSGVCGQLYADSIHCANGKRQYGEDEDDMPVCKAYKEMTDRQGKTYGTRKKDTYWVAVTVIASVLGGLLVVTFLFGSYTYYIRHRDFKTPLAEEDHAAISDLPPIS